MQEGGWAISPGEVRIDGVRLGESTSFPITLVNNKESPQSFSLSCSLPHPNMIRPGYLPIPDTSWVSFTPSGVSLAPHSQQEVTVTITVPNDEEWGGQNYECWLDATSSAMGMLQLALSSRLLLSTSTVSTPGTNWYRLGGITSAVLVVAGIIYGNRRKLRDWWS